MSQSAHGGTRYESEIYADGVETMYWQQHPATTLHHGLWAVTRCTCLFWPDIVQSADRIEVECEGNPLGTVSRN
jgi:hypothetical protein